MINRTITISGQTPSHKNSKQIFRAKNGRTILANNDKYLAWKNGAICDVLNSPAAQKFREKSKENFARKFEISAKFFVQNKIPRDLDNMLASVLDVFVAANIISDDNIFVVPKVSATFGGVSRDFPRAEVEIGEISEEKSAENFMQSPKVSRKNNLKKGEF